MRRCCLILCIIPILILSEGCNMKGDSRVSIDGGKMTIYNNYHKQNSYYSTRSFKFDVKLENGIGYCKDIHVGYDAAKSIDLYEFIKFDSQNVDLAYFLSKNNGDITIGVHSHDGLLDTTLKYHLSFKQLDNDYVKVGRGKCAKIDDYDGYRKYERLIVDYFEKRQLSYNDSIVDLVKCYLVELNKHSKYGFKELYVSEEIPIVSSLKGMEYRISSNLKADYYYLFACKEADEIRDFVKEVKLLDFRGANGSLNNNIPCYMTRSSSGNLCIVLIGINNDFSYKTVPVGIICVDNVHPIVRCPDKNYLGLSFLRSEEIDRMGKDERIYKKCFYIFKNKIVVKNGKDSLAKSATLLSQTLKTTLTGDDESISTERKSLKEDNQYHNWMIEGAVAVSYFSFSNSNVPFKFECFGDVSKIVLNNNIVINWSGEKYIRKTIHLNLDYGDNFIPIKVIDKRGNESTGSIYIRTKRSPDLVIENHVY